MKIAVVITRLAAIAVASALLLTLASLYAPVVLPGRVGEPAVAMLAIAGLLLAVVLMVHARTTRSQDSAREFVGEAQACGSCGRSFSSRRELKQHQAAVHVPALRSRAA